MTFWDRMRAATRAVRGLPAWAKGGINLNPKNFDVYRGPETTVSSSHNELIAIEQRIAVEVGIAGDVRAELVRRGQVFELPETPLVERWKDVFAAHLDCDCQSVAGKEGCQ